MTPRVAISNHRLLDFEQERVTFHWKDYAHGGKQGQMTLAATEFFSLSTRSRATVRTHSGRHLRRRQRSRRGFPVRRWSPHSPLGAKLAPHSSTRPPQTPAASS